MIKITEKKLREMQACEDGIQWFLSHKHRTLKTIIPALLEDNHEDYARWLLTRLMLRPQRVMFGCFAATQVLNIFETRYPNDKRPRLAIQAAEDFIHGEIDRDTLERAQYAAYAAADAAYATAYAAAYATAYAASADARKTIDIRIMNYGLFLLGESSNS